MALQHHPQHPSPPPLLTWKGIQSWSVGCRAPALCRMFVKAKSSPMFGLTKLVKRRRSTEAKPPASPPPVLIQLPAAAANRPSHTHTHRSSPPHPPRASVSSSSPSTAIGSLANCLRRNSDATSPVPRLSTSSYERLSVDFPNGSLDLPRIVKLGSSAAESPLHRLESSVSAHSHGESSGSSRFMGSPAVLSSKLKGTYTRILNATQHNNPHINELFTGNQFLMHVTAAPVSGVGENADMRPSSGLLDVAMRCRESDLKDRIVFFL